MRNLAFWAAAALLVLGALSVTVSMATVRWLYPNAEAKAKPTSVAKPKTPTQETSGSTSTPALPPAFPSGSGPPASPDELLAMDFIRKTAVGDLTGARALSVAIKEDLLRAITELRPSPTGAVRLPAPEGAPPQMLVWTQYRREGLTARGYYLLGASGGKITGVTGPYAPEKGYRPLPWNPTDERARKIDLTPFLGRGLVLVAPRYPDADLLDILTRLHQEYAPRGVEFVLVQDLAAPDWTAIARRTGFAGAIWRVKGRLEDVAVVTQGRLLGAAGLLIDRQGTVVASLAALDPSRYGLADGGVQSIAAQVLRAYGLLP